MANLKFALAGNPNAGKTTLFNALTGSRAHVGTWPGVTVDKKEGVYKKSVEPIAIIDLPGIYSLSPYTPEEIIARNYILDEKPDCVINIIDATYLSMFIDNKLAQPVKKQFTVTFMDGHGRVIEKKLVDENTTPNIVAPELEGYTFIGWDRDFTNITSDMTVYSLYAKN